MRYFYPAVLLMLQPVFMAASESNVLIEDTFTLKNPERSAGSDLRDQALEKGNVSWKVLGNLSISPEGWVTASGTGGSVGVVPLPAPSGSVTIEADLNPSKSGFIALAFMERGDLNFWDDLPLWMTLWPNGKCEIRTGQEVVYTVDSVKGFKKGEFNHVEFMYDSTGSKVSLKLNGEPVVDHNALTTKPVPAFASFRFQEPLTPAIPALDNFRILQSGETSASVSAKPITPSISPQGAGLPPSKPIPELIGKPLWNSDVVTNEPLMFIDSGQGPTAKFLFVPEEIISIRSSSLEKEYANDTDLQLQAGTHVATLPSGSSIPFLKEEELYPPAQSNGAIKSAVGERASKLGKDRWIRSAENTEAYFSKQVVVTYRHKTPWNGYVPASSGGSLDRTLQKLKNKEAVKLVFLGDSISAGCFASGNLKSAPFQPSYTRLVPEGLKRTYGGEITAYNISKGGQVSNYALSQIPLLTSEKPDLIILAFGMNDGSARVSPASYESSISKTIAEVRKEVPDAEFILVSTILGNPEWSASAPDLYPAYRDMLKSLTGPGIALADMTELSTDVLKEKSYWDITVNGVNHPNDFAHRLYAQIILELLQSN